MNLYGDSFIVFDLVKSILVFLPERDYGYLASQFRLSVDCLSEDGQFVHPTQPVEF